MFCPTASLIQPMSHSKQSKALMHDQDGDGRHDVILEKDDSGNTYLHLVMPATAVNFLNGSDGSSLFDFAHNEAREGEGRYAEESEAYRADVDDVFVELGCKVYEVNRVLYRGGERIRSPSDNIFNASV